MNATMEILFMVAADIDRYSPVPLSSCRSTWLYSIPIYQSDPLCEPDMRAHSEASEPALSIIYYTRLPAGLPIHLLSKSHQRHYIAI
jgi:hypothetical protein